MLPANSGYLTRFSTTIIDKKEGHLNRQNNLPTFDEGFQTWLDSQSDEDLHAGLRDDVGEMIDERVEGELERRALGQPATNQGTCLLSMRAHWD